MKILIVDDTRLMLRILGELLHRNGYETVEAKSAAQAVKQLSVDREIDAVITDLDMEPMNGVELFRLAQTLYRITDSGTIAPPPFVLLTAHNKHATGRFRLREEMDFALSEFKAVLQKPIVESQLLSVLASIDTAATPSVACAET